tara:strand:- start:56 stop:373 length:318 start_codon:yes stop_codon:yes gene_type:complete
MLIIIIIVIVLILISAGTFIVIKKTSDPVYKFCNLGRESMKFNQSVLKIKSTIDQNKLIDKKYNKCFDDTRKKIKDGKITEKSLLAMYNLKYAELQKLKKLKKER